MLAGERHAVARAISVIERENPAAGPLLRELRRRAGRAYRIGFTGPPGSGKSTLLGALAGLLAHRGDPVGIVAVDPTSPFTRGAVLGDRVRMSDLDLSDRIFIRSMASRGQHGGLSPRAADAADVLDAAGYPWLFVESVGVGQVELDIRHIVDTTVVILVPESGDQVQAIKSGLMEIADLYVVNKCDRDGAAAMVSSVQSCVALQHHPDPDWVPRVFAVSAGERRGIEEVLAEIERHRAHLGTENRLLLRRRAGMAARITGVMTRQLASRLQDAVDAGELDKAVDQAVSAGADPEEIAMHWLTRWWSRNGDRT